MLVRLMYASRAVPAVDAEELQTILRQCRAGNARLGITGVLCYSDGVFMQVLEGGRAAVSKLYHRIASDPRHTDVELLAYEEIAERRFAGWAMGMVDMGRLNPALLLKYSANARLEPASMNAQAAMALFDELVATASVMCER